MKPSIPELYTIQFILSVSGALFILVSGIVSAIKDKNISIKTKRGSKIYYKKQLSISGKLSLSGLIIAFVLSSTSIGVLSNIKKQESELSEELKKKEEAFKNSTLRLSEGLADSLAQSLKVSKNISNEQKNALKKLREMLHPFYPFSFDIKFYATYDRGQMGRLSSLHHLITHPDLDQSTDVPLSIIFKKGRFDYTCKPDSSKSIEEVTYVKDELLQFVPAIKFDFYSNMLIERLKTESKDFAMHFYVHPEDCRILIVLKLNKEFKNGLGSHNFSSIYNTSKIKIDFISSSVLVKDYDFFSCAFFCGPYHESYGFGHDDIDYDVISERTKSFTFKTEQILDFDRF